MFALFFYLYLLAENSELVVGILDILCWYWICCWLTK